ncbi:MAG: hypothetical protein JOY91_10520 [Sinobacteraceae bacterium]|nr:hypothetical protein [Nevskiaceae bacterium]
MDKPGSLARREVLVAGSMLSGLLLTGTSLNLLAPAHALAAGWQTLSDVESATLLGMARTIAPHDSLEDAAYTVVVKALDAAMLADGKIKALVKTGIGQLGTGFASSSEAERVAVLRKLEHSEFFRLVRAKTLGTLYATPLAFAHFGYEGEAFSKGGYLLRGFNDLDWLPDVPLEDSGPVPR